VFQDDDDQFLAYAVEHNDDDEAPVHETEDVVRDILMMDDPTYNRLVKEYVARSPPHLPGFFRTCANLGPTLRFADATRAIPASSYAKLTASEYCNLDQALPARRPPRQPVLQVRPVVAGGTCLVLWTARAEGFFRISLRRPPE
jgi:hypothetical protein